MFKDLLGRLRGGPSERDEERRAPPAGADAAWADVFRFSFRDPASGLGGLARLAFAPGRGRVRAWLFVLEPDGAVSRLPEETHAISKKGIAGEKMIFRCDAPMKRWGVFLQGPVAKTPAGGDRTRPMKLKADVLLSWEASGPPAEIRAEPPAGAFGEGRYEQPGRLSGHLQIGAARAELAGAPCLRSRRWGGPDLPSGPWTNLWMVGAGGGIALSATRFGGGSAGFVRRGGETSTLQGAELSDFAAPGPFSASVRDAKGRAVSVKGEATAVATLAESEGVVLRAALLRGVCDGEEALGFAETFAPAAR